jgi:hypothetical protein
LQSGFIVRIAGVIDQYHLIFGDFFLFGNHFQESFEVGSTFVLDPVKRIVFYTAPIKPAAAWTAGAALGYLWPLGTQTPIELTPSTSVIDNFRLFGVFVHLCFNTLKRQSKQALRRKEPFGSCTRCIRKRACLDPFRTCTSHLKQNPATGPLAMSVRTWPKKEYR